MGLSAIVMLLAAQAAAGEAVAPEALIECRSTLPAFVDFAEQATQGEPPPGWTPIDQPNSLLIEFRLARPIKVFGRTTSRVAFASSALLAVFDEADAAAVAKPLGITDQAAGAAKFLGERVLSQSAEEDREAGSRFVTRIALNVSTVDTHPGKVLAGCSYRVDVEDL